MHLISKVGKMTEQRQSNPEEGGKLPKRRFSHHPVQEARSAHLDRFGSDLSLIARPAEAGGNLQTHPLQPLQALRQQLIAPVGLHCNAAVLAQLAEAGLLPRQALVLTRLVLV